jgi:type II secretory pathway component PulF
VLLQAGLAMPHALELTGETIGASRLRQRIARVHERILGGARLSEAVTGNQLLPPVAMSMLHVGEEAGRLPSTFERLGRLYDREVKEQVKKALGLLEPIVTVLLGLLVGGIAVIVVGTIYSALRGVGR